MADNTLIMWLAISVMVNVVIIGASFATGTGKAIIKRFRQKLRYKTGKFVNTLFLYKTGVLKELFIKTDESGLFKVNDKSYARNPRLLNSYEGIPTYFHKEDEPNPVNMWKDLESEEASSAEIDKAMMSASNFDLKLWFQKNLFMILIVLGVIAIAFVVGIYFNWQIYDQVVQQKGKYLLAQVAQNATAVLS